ncbi:uncharacterized protein LOC129597905 [Paramacrobiotus metropolitanus]|uniref:uncharacterized protein LOC129597905 n=1 Tax=Paramacrobiotus metropolitanus TaxID=2943436 RepID=UPI0024460AA5|nr:uncharacterized protein LOC129597905 [Paramacrobiotus metropolitanus]
MFQRNIWRYGSVEVVDAKGLARHGMIIDVDKERDFTIDFDYTGHHAEKVSNRKYKISRGAPFTHSSSLEEDQVPRALFQSSPDHPWCWHPCTVLLQSFSFSIVEINLGDRVVRDVLPWNRLRVVNPVQCDPGGITNQYVKHSVRLPDSEGLRDIMKRNGFKRQWHQQTGTIFVKTDETRLFYIAPADHAMTRPECDHQLRLARQHLGVQKMPCDDAESVNQLLPQTLSEILSLLDVHEQANCRRVCRHWNSIAASLETEFVEIHLAKCQADVLASVAWLLYNKVTKDTKILKFTKQQSGQSLPSDYNDRLFDINPGFVQDILAIKNLVVPVIAIAHVAIFVHNLLDYSDEQGMKIAQCFGDVCNQLVLQQVEVRCWSIWRYGGPLLPGLNLVNGRVMTKSVSAVRKMRDLLDAACPEINRKNLKCLNERLCDKSFYGVWKVVRSWQLDDPRFTNYDTTLPETFTLEMAEVDLTSLRRITLYALWYDLNNDLYDYRGYHDDNWDFGHKPADDYHPPSWSDPLTDEELDYYPEDYCDKSRQVRTKTKNMLRSRRKL